MPIHFDHLVPLLLGAHTANPGAAAVLERMFTTRRDAADFNHNRVKRAWTKENLREECCERDCYFEERAEFSEDHGWDWVGKNLCELSVVEG